MNSQERHKTITVSHRLLWALRMLQLGSSGPTEADVRIPHSRAAFDIGVDVPLQHDRPRRCDRKWCVSASSRSSGITIQTWSTGRENHTADLSDTLTPWITNLNDHLGVINVIEFASCTGDDRPSFPKDSNASRNLESIADQVSARIKEDDPAACELSSVSTSDRPRS